MEDIQRYVLLNAKCAKELERLLNEASMRGYVPAGEILRGGEGLLLLVRYQTAAQFIRENV